MPIRHSIARQEPATADCTGNSLDKSVWIAVTFYAAVFGITLVCAMLIVAPGDRRHIWRLTFFGLAAACIKIWLVQQSPQWHDIPPDATNYMLHAQAFAEHWKSLAVDAQAHRLQGLLAINRTNQHVLWNAGSEYAYSSVLGTHEWLYAAYLAVWQLITPQWDAWAIYSNAALAAFFPAAAFGIARCLGASPGTARLAAVLALLDPSAAVNGAWLLKDTAASWLALAALWAGGELIKQPRWRMVAILSIAGALLGGVRFAAFVAILCASACVLPPLLAGKKTRHRLAALQLSIAAGIALLCFSVLYFMPISMARMQNPVTALTTPLVGQDQTLAAQRGHAAADETVVNWREYLKENPLLGMSRSVARTLFAPYPWVAFTHGLDYKTGVELYYPGAAFWALCLPGIFWAFMLHIRRPTPEFLFCAAVLCALLFAYVVFMGEWSTRQRVFMLPVFFAFAAMGWTNLWRIWRNWLQRRGKRDAHFELAPEKPDPVSQPHTINYQ